MDAADDIAALDAAIRHQRAAVGTATIEDRYAFALRPTDNNQVDVGNHGMGRLQRLQIGPRCNGDFLHV